MPRGDYTMTRKGVLAMFPWAVDIGFRQDRRIWEGFCPHGIGHTIGVYPDKHSGIHGCDGCCSGRRLS